jgi:hypothetical protein
MPASGIAVRQVHSPFEDSAVDNASSGDASDRCERFSIGTAAADDDDFGIASAGAVGGEIAQTLEEWIQSDSTSHTTTRASVDESYIDIPPSVNNSDAAERASDTDWNLIQP